MKPPTPTKVKDCTEYWTTPPPNPSARCTYWVERIKNGWRPNRRVNQMGFGEASLFFGIYVWEYRNVIIPLMEEKEDR